jgi:hypothetical protein
MSAFAVERTAGREPVTIDDRITIEPKDILAIQLECPNGECGTVTVWQAPQLQKIAGLVCPGCEQPVIQPRSAEAEHLRHLASALVGLAGDRRVRLQITNPERS